MCSYDYFNLIKIIGIRGWGSEVMSFGFNNQNRINIDVSQFMNGYYNIIITSDDKNYHQSLFINR